VFSALLVLSDAFSFFCLVGALYVAWVFFTWVYFLLEPFFFYRPISNPGRAILSQDAVFFR
jgi:hypothetical protein